MSVRAKFKCNKITIQKGHRTDRNPDGTPKKNERGYDATVECEQRTITLNPVYGNGDPNHENTKFWDASPGGELNLNVVNEAAWKHFELGKEYYVDFTPAE